MLVVTSLGVAVVVIYTLVTFFQWRVFRAQLIQQVEAIRISERGILSIGEWSIINFGRSKNPLINFSVLNSGHTPAFVLDGTYEYAIESDLPRSFPEKGAIQALPGMLAQGDKTKLVISGLPAMSDDLYARIQDGRSAVYTRIIVIYRDIFPTTYELRVTGRYGQITDTTGKTVIGFSFPERPLGEAQWNVDADTFFCLRKYNSFGRKVNKC